MMKKGIVVLTLFIICGVFFIVMPLPRIEKNVGVVECDGNFFKGSLQTTSLAERPVEKDFSLLSWNVYKEQKDDWQKDFVQLSSGIDILALQESPLKNGDNAVLDTLGYNYAQTEGFRVDETRFGVLVGLGDDMAGQVTRSCGLRATEPLIRIPKTALLTRIATSHGELMVVSIHCINFSLGVDAYKEQLARLATFLGQYKNPLIVAGDFNTWSDKRQLVVDKFALQLGLQDVEYTKDTRSTIFSHALDHVFVRGVHNVKARVYQVNSSDHNPIRVDFSL